MDRNFLNMLENMPLSQFYSRLFLGNNWPAFLPPE
jgi:hypothetical protein